MVNMTMTVVFVIICLQGDIVVVVVDIGAYCDGDCSGDDDRTKASIVVSYFNWTSTINIDLSLLGYRATRVGCKEYRARQRWYHLCRFS
jgi:hypothetical protein